MRRTLEARREEEGKKKKEKSVGRRIDYEEARRAYFVLDPLSLQCVREWSYRENILCVCVCVCLFSPSLFLLLFLFCILCVSIELEADLTWSCGLRYFRFLVNVTNIASSPPRSIFPKDISGPPFPFAVSFLKFNLSPFLPFFRLLPQSPSMSILQLLFHTINFILGQYLPLSSPSLLLFLPPPLPLSLFSL